MPDKNEGLDLKQFSIIQGAVMVYSFCGVFQKLASRHPFLSWSFILLYGLSIAVLFVYALLWQMVLKRTTLTVAYSNRAIAMIWSLVWSAFFFQEVIRWNQVIGAIIICIGVREVVRSANG